MARQIFLLILFFCLLPTMAAANVLFRNETDRAALLALKLQITNDPSGVLPSWNDTTNLCNWEGVLCSKKHKQRVVSIDISSRGLVGYISSSIENITFLHHLNLSQNQIFNTIPPSLFTMPRLHILDLSLNFLHGEIPYNLSSSLMILDLTGNFISGSIPSSIGHLSKLRILSLYNNSLTGKIPPSLGNLSSLKQLSLMSNLLEGSMPEDLGNHQSPQFLQVSQNKLSGVLPTSIFNLSSVYYFGVEANSFEGTIPTTLGNNLPNLQVLLLGLNQFKGPLPASLRNASKLYFIDMSQNNFSGVIPSSLGTLTNLSTLNLDSNHLEASNRSSWKFLDVLTNCSRLKKLYLSYNNLSGALPNSIANLSTMIQVLDIYGNQILESIPSRIDNLVNLISLNLGQNLLTGHIPRSIGKLRMLQLLDLRDNLLTGTLPTYIGNLTQLVYLFLNATSTSLQGNYGLCGGISDLQLLTCLDISSSENKRKPLLEILLPIIAAFSLILFSILCFNYKRKNIHNNSSKPKIREDNYPKVSYAELVKAINEFSLANPLGSGQYSLVYNGSLDDYGYTNVAVKVFSLQQRGAFRFFTDECEVLRHIRHRNIVKVLTCCVGIDSKGDDFMAIVFEFMPNGNLDTWLHADDNTMDNLDLIKRLDIAINIIDALCYLHYECEAPIIHCDLKLSNVLLDDDMVAHVGDFGISSLLHKVVNN